MWDSGVLLGALTPKFYVALTGTSSLISGLILIFEWWYFRKYGTSFIEQVSLTQLGPWLGADSEPSPEPPPSDCKLWRNPQALLRGAEYGRLWIAARRAPLTYYDMNLSAQEHQKRLWLSAACVFTTITQVKEHGIQMGVTAWFGCGGAEVGSGAWAGAEQAMARAWREREPAARVAAARAALHLRPDCAAALLLLAEEDAPTVMEAERVLRRAWRCAESAWRAHGGGGAALARRDAAVLAHVKRRAAMCARRLGKLRDAARMFRELARDAPPALSALSLHENLIEVLLEQRAYPDVQAVIARCEETGAPASATLLYTAALLRARAAAQAPPRAQLERAALEALRRAIEFNPYVPPYLLELRALTLPPEHILRRGDSEAVSYAFCHLRHWRRAEPALKLLAAACQMGEYAGWSRVNVAGVCSRCGDRELLPPHHVSTPRRAPGLLPALAAAALAVIALIVLRWPSLTSLPALTADPRALLRLLADV